VTGVTGGVTGRVGGSVSAVDPFDLPEWLGTSEVTWVALSAVRGAARVQGRLEADGRDLPCDLMAADLAYPEPLLDDRWRRQAHQAWTHGQVLLVEYDGRLTLAVPGTAYSADGALETVGRLAKAVGVPPGRYAVTLRL
jgi:hypothetical protein